MSRILHHVGRNDFKKTRQRQIGEQKERAAQKLKESQEAEAKRKQRKQIKEAARPYKSNWREETQLQESDWRPISGSIANSTSQTFVSRIDGTTKLHVSGLGGVETTPKTAVIDFGFGDTLEIPAPNFSELGLQGYAPPLSNQVMNRDDSFIKSLEKYRKDQEENLKSIKNTLKSLGTSWEELRANSWALLRSDGSSVVISPTSDTSDMFNWTDNVEIIVGEPDPKAEGRPYKTKGPDTFNAVKSRIANVTIQNSRIVKTIKHEIGEKPTRESAVNSQLDASQEFAQNVDSDYMMNARVTDTSDAPIYDPYFQRIYDPAKTPFGSDYGEVSQVIDGEELLPQRIQDILKKGRNKPARGGPGAIDRELLDNYFKPEVQDVLQHRPELHDRYLNQMYGGAGGGYVPGGGMIDPSSPANAGSAALRNFSDFVRGLPQPGDAGYVNPNIIGRLARSATDNIRYAPGGQMITGLPSGVNYDPNFRSNMKAQRVVPGRNYGTPLQTMGRGELNVGRMYQDTNQLTRGTPFGNKSGTYNVQPTPTKGMRGVKNPFGSVVNRGWTGTPEIQIPKGGPQAVRASADDLARAAAKSSTKASRFLSRFIPGANAVLAGADVAQRSSQGDYFGAALGAASAFPGPAGWLALGGQIAYDAAGRPFMGSPSNVTPTSGRGAGRSSFPTSDGNVVPRSNSANANSVGQRGSDGGMTDAQIKAAQDKANAARRMGKMSDIRGSQANKGFAPDPQTGEPRYTGMNDRQYSDATNKIADKYNKLRAPIERQYAEFAGQQAPESLMNKLNALNDAQTAEENALAAKRAAQENAFNDALQDYNDKLNAESEARAKAIDEIDNEKDPYSDLIADLGELLEKLRREGKLIKGYEIVGPGEEGYVDTTNMANAIGYNRRPIYTARAEELMSQLNAAQDAQTEWLNDRDKRREAAEKADYKGGQGGLPIGTTSLRGGAGSSAGARKPTPPENMSQSAALARQAASARMNPQQRRKRGMKESTTWSRLKKYR